MSMEVKVDGGTVTVDLCYGYAEEACWENVIKKIDAEDLIPEIMHRDEVRDSNEVIEEQLCFARDLVYEIKSIARSMKSSNPLKSTMKDALAEILSEIENSQLEL